MHIALEELPAGEEPPYELLLLADPDRQMIDRYIHAGCCYLARSGSLVLGVIVLVPVQPGRLEIKNIAVRPDHQGLGRAMLLETIRIAKDHGSAELDICTGNSSLAQLGLYQRCGFRIVAVERDFFVRHYYRPIVENGIQCRDLLRLRLEF